MCGVAAWLGEGAYGAVYRLLLGLQHRGHDAAGVVAAAAPGLRRLGGRGLVFQALPASGEAFGDSRLVLGHVRYSTSGGYGDAYQPLVSRDGGVAAAFNGNIVNYVEAARELLGYTPSWDAEALVEILSLLLRETGSLADALREAATILRGAYSVVAATPGGELAAARDPRGIRPLAYSLGEGYAAVASETGALQALGLPWRELPAGGLLHCPGGPGSCYLDRLAAPEEPLPCAFEYVYFLRPDSVFEGVVAHEARKRMGALLARMDSVEADLVAPVPDSGRSAALGYAEERGLPLDEVIYLNRFVGRAFIADPSVRRARLGMKYSVIPGSVDGKRVVLVDDSIVRGDTARRLVSMLRAAGAREVHLRSAAPPVVSPCFFGVDIPTRSELVAHGRSQEEVASIVGADSVLYNTVANLEKAVGRRLCMGCFTAVYPMPLDVAFLEQVFGYSRRRGAARVG